MVLLRRLDHMVNINIPWYRTQLVTGVNGRPINGLKDLIGAIESSTERWLVLDLGEPGRFIVGNSAALVTQVLYRKRSGGKDYVVADAGMTELLRPSHYGAYHKIQAMRTGGALKTVDVVGPVCESGDFLALDRELDDVAPGDYLVVCDVGAYGYAMASNYNSRLRPAEVLVDGDRYAVITTREEYADLTRFEVAHPEWVQSEEGMG